MKKIKSFMQKASAEILILLGAFLIIGVTATINIIVAAYVTGVMLIALGLFIAKGR